MNKKMSYFWRTPNYRDNLIAQWDIARLNTYRTLQKLSKEKNAPHICDKNIYGYREPDINDT